MHLTSRDCNRRAFLLYTGAAGVTLAVSPVWAQNEEKGQQAIQDRGKEEDVGPNEDLMREHGVLRRGLLCYREGVRRLEHREKFDITTIHEVAQVVRSFVEDYHEKQEEQSVFPRFQERKTLTVLVDTLKKQHDAGRALTDKILQLATRDTLEDASRNRDLYEAVEKFIRMYEPHAAREDTVLFPAFRDLLTSNKYDALGDEFEKREHQMFGEDGFEKMVETVGGIERRLGIDDLAKFTPTL